MTHVILSDMVASISELKQHPMATVNKAKGKALAILNRNEPVFYCIPAKTYKYMMDELEDARLVNIVKARAGEKEIAVDIDDI
jgi:antitoxin StbD